MPPVPVSKPFVRPTAAAAAEGAAVALTCAVREGTEPLSFSWQHREPRGGPPAPPAGLGGSGAELRLTPANRSHAGWYACTVRNEVNNRTSEPVYLDIVCECPGAQPHLPGGGVGGCPKVGTSGTSWGGIPRAGDATMATMVCPWPPSTLPPWYVHSYRGTSMAAMHRDASVATMYPHHHDASVVWPWPTSVLPP